MKILTHHFQGLYIAPHLLEYGLLVFPEKITVSFFIALINCVAFEIDTPNKAASSHRVTCSLAVVALIFILNRPVGKISTSVVLVGP